MHDFLPWRMRGPAVVVDCGPPRPQVSDDTGLVSDIYRPRLGREQGGGRYHAGFVASTNSHDVFGVERSEFASRSHGRPVHASMANKEALDSGDKCALEMDLAGTYLRRMGRGERGSEERERETARTVWAHWPESFPKQGTLMQHPK